MSFQQGQAIRATELARGVRAVNLEAQARMQLRQRVQARHAAQEGLPARALAGKEEGAQRRFKPVSTGTVGWGGAVAQR
ncbi:hypothetical protein D3C72_2318870 [compost metagenome]